MNNGVQSTSKTQAGKNCSVLLTLHSRWLRTVISTRSGDASAVEEIFQEVFVAVVKQHSEIPTEKVAPWLYRVAVRQALLHRRRLGRQRKLRNRLAQERSVDAESGLDPLAWVLSSERQQLIREAITRLNAKDAEILMLKHTEDWSYHELAKHLGVSHSAIETRLHRARQRLRLELASLDIVEADL